MTSIFVVFFPVLFVFPPPNRFTIAHHPVASLDFPPSAGMKFSFLIEF
jgi:hypothetical protein